MNFIERNTKKVALIMCLATACSAVTTVYAAQNAEGWHGSGIERVYMANGEIKKDSWVFNEEDTYYVDKNGNPITSAWKDINNNRYFFNADGKKVSGVQIINGKRYFFKDNGVLPIGWSEGINTYYDEFGVKLTGTQIIDGKIYYFGEDGETTKGWLEVNGQKVFFQADGTPATGVQIIDGIRYNFNADGTLSTGWVIREGEKSYYDNYGFMYFGWQEIDGNKYYFNAQGYAATNTEYEGHQFDANGIASEKQTTSSAKLTRSSSSSNTMFLPSANGSVASAAMAQVGIYQDCTALVSNSLRAVGIYFRGWPANYMSLGQVTSNPQPGDIIYYANGGTGAAHVAIYIGNGKAVHGGWRGNQTVVGSAYVGSGPVFIRITR